MSDDEKPRAGVLHATIKELSIGGKPVDVNTWCKSLAAALEQQYADFPASTEALSPAYLQELGIELRNFALTLRLGKVLFANPGLHGRAETIVHSEIAATDRDDPTKGVELTAMHRFGFRAGTPEELLAMVRQALITAVTHEIDERLFFRGKRARDPHEKDG